MGERGFETSNLGGDLWPMGFDVDLALDTTGSRKISVGGLNNIGNAAVSNAIGYGEMQHMLLQRFDELNDGDISQITDLTNSLPKGDPETAQSLLAKIACHDLARELTGAQESTQKGIEANLFGSVTNNKPPLQPVDVYGRVICYEGKLVLQLKHFNINTNYPISVGECWLCRETITSESQIHSHKHVLQGLFQVNDEFVQMDIDHYIIPAQALEPDPDVIRNLNTNNLIDHSNSQNLGQVVSGNRSLALTGNMNGSETLQNSQMNMRNLSDSLHDSQRTLEATNDNLQTRKLQYTETDLNNGLSSAQQSLNSSVAIDSNTCLSSFGSEDLRNMSMASAAPIIQNESGILHHITHNSTPSNTLPSSTLALSTSNLVSNSVNNTSNMLSNAITSHESQTGLKDIENIQDLCNSSNSLTRNDGRYLQHTTYEPNVGNKEQLDNYHFFEHPYSYPYENESALNNHLPKFHPDSLSTEHTGNILYQTLNSNSQKSSETNKRPQPTASTDSILYQTLNSSSQKPLEINKRTEIGARKRKSRAQKKPSSIKMRDDKQNELSHTPLGMAEKKFIVSPNDTLEDWFSHSFPTNDFDSNDQNKKIDDKLSDFSTSESSALANVAKDVACKISTVNNLTPTISSSMHTPLTSSSVPTTAATGSIPAPPTSNSVLTPLTSSSQITLPASSSNAKPFLINCQVCKKEFKNTLKEFEDHLVKHKVPDTFTFICSFCSKKFNTTKYIKHLKTHFGERLFCKLCPASFSRTDKLRRHVDSVHNKSRPHKCNICSKSFHRLEYLKAHHNIHLLNNNKFKCDMCPKSCSSRYNLETHKKSHYNDKPHACEVCGSLFSRKDFLLSHFAKEHKNHRFKCEVCSQLFTRIDCLRRHKITHNTIKVTYDCDLCGKKFNRKDRLTAHKNSHKVSKANKCTECPADFKRKESLANHLKVHKIKEQCNICLKFLPTTTQLQKHLRWHEAQIKMKFEREYFTHHKCEFCSKTFKTKEIMCRHVLRIHKKSESTKPAGPSVEREKKFFCEHCSKSFTRSCNLRSHMKIHNKGSEDEEMLAELPTVLNASKSNSKKKKVPYLCRNDDLDNKYASIEATYSSGIHGIDSMSKEYIPNPHNIHLPLDESFVPVSSSAHSSYNSQFTTHLSSDLSIPTSTFCNSSPNSPINLSTEAITAAAYLLAHPFYEGPYQ